MWLFAMTVSHGSQARTTDFSRVDINTGKFVHAVSVYCTVYCCVLSSKEKNMLKNEKVNPQKLHLHLSTLLPVQPVAHLDESAWNVWKIVQMA